MSSTTIYGACPNTTIGPFHYLYRITNLVENKHYYGIRTSKTSLPQHDLGVKYFSSSHDKEFLKDQREHPENYKYKIVVVSYSRKLVADLEIKIHNKFNVGINPKFYNKANQTSNGFDASKKVAMKDSNGNNVLVSSDDHRISTGELVGVTKGLTAMKDSDGNIHHVSIDDPRIESGELTSVNKGLVSIYNPETKKNLRIKPDTPLPTGWVYGLIGRLATRKEGSRKIFNPELNKEMCLNPGDILPTGWFYGRLLSVIGIPKGSRHIFNQELKQNKVLKPGEILPMGWEYGMKKFSD